jgi:YHS domain-containing protein
MGNFGITLLEPPMRHALSIRRCLIAVLVGGAAALAGCSAMKAQNPSTALQPVNAVADGDDERVMLKGHDVVAYFTQGRHALGSNQFKSVHEGVTFRFASAEHKALFDANPKKYQPEYGGYCANGIAYGIPWGGDADTWRIIDGRLFINGGPDSKAAFELDLKTNIERADRYWRDEVAGSHSFYQRAKRLVFRVPHYKSGEQLAAEVAAAKATGK